MPRPVTLSIAFVLATVSVAPAQPPTPPAPIAKVLVLGMFHFQDAGLDAFKPQHDIDVLAPERQKEIGDLVACLSEFSPTKIAVEAPASFADTLDRRFAEYHAGNFSLPSNETYQLGFRLARAAGLKGVHPIDAEARWYEPFVDPEAYAVGHGQAESLMASEAPWESFYQSLYAYDDSIKTQQTLREHILYLNSPARLSAGHGHYLIGTFKAGVGDDYPGADSKTGWYNRNLRIFANIQRLAVSPGERIIVIIGAGHVPIIRHALGTSPQFDLVEVAEFLADGRCPQR